MGLLDIFKWGLRNQSEHLSIYSNNEELYNAALSLWNSLEIASFYAIVALIVIGLLLPCFYYYVYNKWPGRKYSIQHWILWLVITLFLTIVVNIFLGRIIVTSTLKEKLEFIWNISIISGIYAILMYLVVSIIICNSPVPTNAYRFLKIGK